MLRFAPRSVVLASVARWQRRAEPHARRLCEICARLRAGNTIFPISRRLAPSGFIGAARDAPCRRPSRIDPLPPPSCEALPVLVVLHGPHRRRAASATRCARSASPRYPQAGVRRSAARDAGGTTPGVVMFSAAPRAQRQPRLHPPRDRHGSRCRTGRTARFSHLPRRADARQAPRRAVAPHPRAAPRSAINPNAPPPPAARSATTGPITSYHWHRDGFDLPAGCELLAEGDDFSGAGFRTGRCFGVQFHPDVTHAMMHRWTTRGHARLELPGARALGRAFTSRSSTTSPSGAWLAAFLDGWLHRPPRAAVAEDDRASCRWRRSRLLLVFVCEAAESRRRRRWWIQAGSNRPTSCMPCKRSPAELWPEP